MTKVAVVIGIDRYDDHRWPALSCCVNDASDVAMVLMNEPFNYEVDLLLDEVATRADILRSLRQAIDQAPESFVFYFAGHGGTDELGSYLVSFDNAEFTEGVELLRLAQQVSTGLPPSSACLVLLDCCHAGGIPLDPAAAGGMRPLASDGIDRNFPLRMSGSRAFICACTSEQLASEIPGTGHGLFTAAILRGLDGEAVDKNGFITAHSLFDFAALDLRDAVQNVTFKADVEQRLVLAQGLDPGIVSLLPDPTAVDEAVAKAELLLDDYSKSLRTGLAEWKASGFRDASRQLEPIADWFNRRLKAVNGLGGSPEFMDLFRSMNGRLVQLGTVDPGTRLQSGVLQSIVGSGAFGTVWLVQLDDGERAAYKIYHPNELGNPEKVSRFANGYEAMRQLDHPAIVQIEQFTRAPIGFFMEYIDGPNLRKLGVHTFDDPVDIVMLLRTVAEALEHAHNRRVIHRDVKPENIVCRFVDGQWLPCLTDFDLAWFSTNTQLTDVALGTVSYSAPEQFAQFNKSLASGFHPQLDVYSLGQLMYFAVTGSDPSPTDRRANADRFEHQLSSYGSASASESLMELYVASTTLAANDRLDSMTEFVASLSEAAARLTSAPESHKTAGDFLQQVVFELTGAVQVASAGERTFDSRTGQTTTYLSVVENSHRKARAEVVAHIIHNGRTRIGMESLSNEKMRRILNDRIDQALKPFEGAATRRAGTSGHFATYIHITIGQFDRAAVQKVRDVLAAVTSIVEAM